MALPQLLNRLEEVVPSGFIGMWSGSANTIPTGWALCDGANGTPNLTDRFVLGAGKAYQPGATGGAATATPSVTAENAKTGLSLATAAPGRGCRERRDRDRHMERCPQYLDRGRRDRDRHSGHDAGWEHTSQPSSFRLGRNQYDSPRVLPECPYRSCWTLSGRCQRTRMGRRRP